MSVSRVRENRMPGLRHEAPCCIPDSVGRNLEETFLGLLANLDPKGEGDNSMPDGSGHRESVEGGPLPDPRDTAKAGLPEA
jgi:hypothetical protein